MVQNFLMFTVRFPVWIPELLTSMARKPRWFEGRELPHVDPSTAREDGDKLGKEGNDPSRWNQFTLESQVYSNHLRPALDTSRCEAPSPWRNHTRFALKESPETLWLRLVTGLKLNHPNLEYNPERGWMAEWMETGINSKQFFGG